MIKFLSLKELRGVPSPFTAVCALTYNVIDNNNIIIIITIIIVLL